MDSWLWIVIAIVVVAAVIAAAYMAKRGTENKRRHDAASLREDAREQNVDMQHKEAAAMEARANAKEAQIEAKRLEEEVASGRDDLRENLQKADHLDPDVDTSEGRDTHR